MSYDPATTLSSLSDTARRCQKKEKEKKEREREEEEENSLNKYILIT